MFVTVMISNWNLLGCLARGREPSPWWGRWQACLTDEGIVTLQEKSTCANLIGQWSVRKMYFQQFERFSNFCLKFLSFSSPHQSPYGDSFPTGGKPHTSAQFNHPDKPQFENL